MDRLISEQAVIDAICKVCAVEVKPSECRYRKGLFGGCKKYEAIKAIPSAEPCGDAISREAVINLKWLGEASEEFLEGYANAIEDARVLPSVNPQETKTGHWITKIKSDLRGDMWPTNPRCSECGGEPNFSNTIYNYKFCPNCGARMVKPQERSEDVT